MVSHFNSNTQFRASGAGIAFEFFFGGRNRLFRINRFDNTLYCFFEMCKMSAFEVLIPTVKSDFSHDSFYSWLMNQMINESQFNITRMNEGVVHFVPICLRYPSSNTNTLFGSK